MSNKIRQPGEPYVSGWRLEQPCEGRDTKTMTLGCKNSSVCGVAVTWRSQTCRTVSAGAAPQSGFPGVGGKRWKVPFWLMRLSQGLIPQAVLPVPVTLPVSEQVHNHFRRYEVEYLQFAFRWMNNLLMRELPLRCTIRLWDTYQVRRAPRPLHTRLSLGSPLPALVEGVAA